MIRSSMDSGIVTHQPRRTGPGPESVLTNTTMDPGTVGADTSTPVQGQPHPQNGARPKPFGLNLPTLVSGKLPPQSRSQPRSDLSNLQSAGLTTSLKDTVTKRDLPAEISIASSSDADPVDSASSTLRLRRSLSSVDRPVGTNTDRSLTP